MDVFNHMVNNTRLGSPCRTVSIYFMTVTAAVAALFRGIKASKSGDFVAGPNAEQAANPSS